MVRGVMSKRLLAHSKSTGKVPAAQPAIRLMKEALPEDPRKAAAMLAGVIAGLEHMLEQAA